jgi:2-polyprenyl-6-methoxyphenol hydroxylase-like FAD-dependent oxidoreductase
MNNRTALVNGAGIGGLAVAVALAQAGRSPVVLEQADVHEPLDGSVFLYPASLAALDSLGAGGLVRSRARIATDPATDSFAMQVARADVQTALLELLGAGRVRPGSVVCCARQDDRLARVHLIGAGDVAAPVLVDAAGTASPVRSSVLGRRKAARQDLSRSAVGRVAFAGNGIDALDDALMLAAALAAEPIVADALERYARSPRLDAAAPERRRSRLRAPRVSVAPA